MRSVLALSVVAILFANGCNKEASDSGTPPAKEPAAKTAQAGAGEPAVPPPATESASDAAATPAPGASSRPLYYERAITDSDLEGRSLRELSLMRNTIFARGGNTFHTPWLKEYFEAQPWYEARKELDKSKLNDTDWKNAKTVGTREASLGKEQLEAMHQTVVSAIGDGKPTPEQTIELRLISQRLGRWVGGDAAAPTERTPLEDPSLLDALISVSTLEPMSRRDLRLLRNTIYARHGYPFKSELLDDYFAGIEWYERDETFTNDRLTAIDKKNIKLIKSVENARGGPLTEHEHKELDGWFVEA